MVKFVGNVYLAMQMPSINNLLVSLGHLLSLIVIFILTKTTDGSLFNVAFAFSLSPIVVYVISYPITFNLIFKDLKPTLKGFSVKYLKGLFNVGISFFFLQISGVVLFAMSNIIISKLFGPEQVTPYNISYRYFTLINMLLAILVQPLWTAVTDAKAKGDTEWIKVSLKKTEQILFMLGIVLLLMLAVSKFIYAIWIGSDVEIPFELSTVNALYVFIIITSTAYSYFLNGMGILRIQVINTIIVAMLFVPICYIVSSWLGIIGVPISMCIMNSSGALLNRIQVKKILKGNAHGIWAK
jgi:O-antigen/teichoic acid export membrane protein